jgi:hypothetical protein
MTSWHPTFNLRLLLSANWKDQQRHDLTARQDRQEHALLCIEKTQFSALWFRNVVSHVELQDLSLADWM